MHSRFYRVPLQLELPLDPHDPSDEDLHALWVAAKARLKSRKELHMLKNSRVELEQKPN